MFKEDGWHGKWDLEPQLVFAFCWAFLSSRQDSIYCVQAIISKYSNLLNVWHMTPKGECVPLVDMCTTRLCQRDEEWLPSLSTLKTDNVYLVNPPCVEICPPHFSYLLYVGAVGTEQWPLEAYGGDSLRGQWPDEWVRSQKCLMWILVFGAFCRCFIIVSQCSWQQDKVELLH